VKTLVVELLQSGEHVSRLISLSTMMHAGRYNLPAINPEKHASSGYKKLEERRTTKKKKRRQGGRASRTREKVGSSTRERQKRAKGKNVRRGNR
jgi:hypothetical protein